MQLPAQGEALIAGCHWRSASAGTTEKLAIKNSVESYGCRTSGVADE